MQPPGRPRPSASPATAQDLTWPRRRVISRLCRQRRAKRLRTPIQRRLPVMATDGNHEVSPGGCVATMMRDEDTAVPRGIAPASSLTRPTQPRRRAPVLDLGRNRIARWAVGFLLVLLSLGSAPPVALCQDMEVIVHPATVETTVSVNALRAIFGMRLRSWPDGTPITVFVLSDRSPHHDAFSKTFLNVFPHQLRQAWDRLVFSGTGQAPVTVGTELQMKARVAATPGGIGYLPREMVDESVHVLNIR